MQQVLCRRRHDGCDAAHALPFAQSNACRRYAQEAVTENGREMYLRLAEAEEVSANQVCEQPLVITEGE